jgi:hypothetical protein
MSQDHRPRGGYGSAVEAIQGMLPDGSNDRVVKPARWTTPDAMTARAAKIKAASSVDLGPSRFIPHAPPEMLRPWDGSQWGRYAPPR